MKRLLDELVAAACELIPADCAIAYPYDSVRRQFYDQESIAACGLLAPRGVTDKPRERGLAALVGQVGEFIAHNTRTGDIAVDFDRLTEPGVDRDAVIRIMQESQFIQREKIKAFLGFSLRTDEDLDERGEPRQVGIFYINHRKPHRFSARELHVARIYARQIASAIQGIRVYSAVERRARELKAVYETALTIAAQEYPLKLYQTIVDQACKLLKGKGGKLYLVVRGQARVELVAVKGIRGQALKPGFSLAFGEGMAGKVAQSRRPLIVNDYSTWEGRVDQLTGLFSAVIEVPMLLGDDVMGVLAVFDDIKKRVFVEDDGPPLQQLAQQAALAIHSADRLKREQTLREQAETLQRILSAITSNLDLREVGEQILVEIGRVIQYGKASMQLFQGQARELKAHRGYQEHEIDDYLLRPVSRDRLVQRVLDSKRPLILPDTTQDPDWEIRPGTATVRSWVGLPLMFGDKPVGLITLDHPEPFFYRPSDAALLEWFAPQAAIALENARLLDDAQLRIRDMEILNKTLLVISAELSIETLLKACAVVVTERLECSHCTIFLAEVIEGEVWIVPKETRGEEREQILTRQFRPLEGIAGWVFYHGEPVVLADARDDARFAAPRRTFDKPRSMIAVPIKVGARTIGVITADQDKHGWFDENDMQLLATLAQQTGIAVERAIALRVLDEVSRSVVATQGIEEILKNIVSGTIRLSNSRVGVVHLLDPDRQSVVITYQHPKEFDLPPSRFTEGLGATYHIVQQGLPLIIEDTRESPYANPVISSRVRSMIGLPLKLEKRVIGVLFLFDPDFHSFTETEVSLLETLARQTALAIQNTNFLERLRRQREARVEAIHEIVTTITTATSKDEVLGKILEWAIPLIAKGSLAEILVPDQAGEALVVLATRGQTSESRYTRVPISQGITGWVFRNNRPLYVPQAQRDTRYLQDLDSTHSEMAVPLRKMGKAIGVLNMEHPEENAFAQEDIRLAEAIAGLAVVAMEHSDFFIALEERASRLARLHDITTAISQAETDLEAVLDSIVNNLSTVFYGAACAVRLYDAKKDVFTHRVVTPGSVLKDQVAYSPRKQGISRYVIRQRAAQFVEDALSPSPPGPRIRKVLVTQGVRSTAALPLLREGEAIGVLYVNLPTPHEYSENDRQILAIYANQAAVAITNAQLYQQILKQREADKLAVISHIGIEIAHRLTKLVGTISVRANIAKEALNPKNSKQAEAIKQLEVISRQTLRLMGAAQEIKRSRNIGAVQLQSVSLNRLLEAAIQMSVESQPILEKRIEIRRQLSKGPLKARAEKDRMLSTFMGVIQNAIEAIRKRGIITVATRRHMLDNRGFAEIAISDTGHGIAAKNLPDIFRLFYTTKDEGLGIDLWRNREYLREIGGDIQVTSVKGKGSTFTITVPLSA